MVAIGWVVVITSGLTSFVFAKKYIDKRRLELIKAKGRERLLEAEKHAKNNSYVKKAATISQEKEQ